MTDSSETTAPAAETVAADAPEPPEATPDAPEAPATEDTTEEVFGRDYVEKLRRENAGYRDRAKAAESAVETLQRQQVETRVAAHAMKPAALWATTELADVIDPETGAVDFGKVDAAVKAARTTLGLNEHMPARRQGLASGTGITPSAGPSWESAFARPER